MGRCLSMDLRVRVMAAVDGGMSRRAAGVRFGVASSTVIRWAAQKQATGSFAAMKQGGDRLSKKIEAHGALVLSIHDASRDATLEELRTVLYEKTGVQVAVSTLFRFFKRHNITRKKRPATPASRTVQTS
jgi:transposase